MGRPRFYWLEAYYELFRYELKSGLVKESDGQEGYSSLSNELFKLQISPDTGTSGSISKSGRPYKIIKP
ncbi:MULTISPECIES: hypothetical protein [Nitrosomonas]|uniref:hypothetical protein n=1 Tax=Nitrosomonas TaxID=914 RepID=UPI00130EFC6B|nr:MULTISPECIES: hypothetical protein [Nitrosomonas]UVS63106.1 hypothetical protein NX761_08450 [Nitrosomonas sp. PLL12]